MNITFEDGGTTEWRHGGRKPRPVPDTIMDAVVQTSRDHVAVMDISELSEDERTELRAILHAAGRRIGQRVYIQDSIDGNHIRFYAAVPFRKAKAQ